MPVVFYRESDLVFVRFDFPAIEKNEQKSITIVGHNLDKQFENVFLHSGCISDPRGCVSVRRPSSGSQTEKAWP
jgi:hypothetical protein